MHLRIHTLSFCLLTGLFGATLASAQPYIYVANLAGNNVSVVNGANDSVVAFVGVSAAPSGLAVTPDGNFVYVACQGASAVSVIGTATNTVVATIGVGTTPIQLAISPNGAQVYVADQGSNQVSIIDRASNAVIGTINVGSHPFGVAFSPDGSRAYVGNLWDGTVSIINTSSQTVVNTVNSASGPGAIAVSNGRLYVANEYANVVTVFDLNGNLLSTISGFTYPNGVAATPDGTQVLVTDGNASTVSVISTASNTVTATIPVGLIPTSVAISSDGTQAYVTNEYGFSLSQINVAANTVINTIHPVGVYPFSVATTPPAAQPPTVCSYSLSSSGTSFGSGTGSGSLGVTAPGGCSWSASTDSSWLSITSGFSGSGNGSVSFSVAPNPSTGARTGKVLVSGQAFAVTQSGESFTAIRVRCGGPQLTDANGNLWSSDNAANYSVTNASIANTSTPGLYQTEAWSTSNLQYSFNVPNGSFTVTLKFAEFYLTQRNQRVVNILVNGNLVSSGFDILAYTSPNTAFDLSIPVSVTNGQITISLVPVTGTAKLNAIAIN